MGLFGGIFGNSDNKDTNTSAVKWNDLTEIKQLDEIVAESAQTPVIIFKHSTRCGISRMALKGFEGNYSIGEEQAKPYYLDLLNHRDISNEIANRFGVMHQSPQVLVIKNGVAVYNESHGDIDANEVKGRL